MTRSTICISISILAYLGIVLVVGFHYAKKMNPLPIFTWEAENSARLLPL